MDTPTVCHSIIGSMTARFDKDTPDEIVRLASDELLFFIRSKMASDSYVSSSIMKVIYVGPRESIVSESQSQSQNEGKNNASTIVAIVMSIIVILLVLLFVLVVVKKRRRMRRRKSNKGSLSNRFSRIGYTANESLPISDTEQTWRRALIIDDTWKKALNTYERNSKVVIHPDQVIDKEDSHCADDAAVELMMDNKDEQEQQHDESLMHAKQILEEGQSRRRRRRRRKQKYVAQDVNDRLEPSNDYDKFTIDGVHPIEVTHNEPSDQSAVQDVQIVEDFNEVVTVTSVDSEEQYPSSSYGVGIEHTYYGDDDDDENDDDNYAQQQGRDDEDEPEQSHYESNNHGDEVKYDGEVYDGSASRSDSFNNSWCYDEEENKT